MNLVHVRVRIDVVQPHPGAEFAKRAGKIEKSCADIAAVPGARRIFEIAPIGRSVLRDNQQFLDARRNEALGLRRNTSAAGRERRSPRSLGMMQKLQRLLQPSEIFRYA